MIIKFLNGDKLYFPNIKNEVAKIEAPVEKDWVRDSRGNWVRAHHE